MSKQLTSARLRMLRFLDFVGRPFEGVKPGQVAMLRTMEEYGWVSRGSIRHARPKWSLTAKGMAVLNQASPSNPQQGEER